MWYSSPMPTHLPTRELEAAEAAVAYAQLVRKTHRRRTERTSRQRIDDVEFALDRLSRAMVPLRSMRGKFPYGPQTPAAERNRQAIRDAAEEIKRERIKLWKMLPNKPRAKEPTT